MTIKFGALAIQAHTSWAGLVEAWQELDQDSNFDSLWLADHFLTGLGTDQGSDGPFLESWTSLAALAQLTNRARIGVLVTGNTYRHPAVLAKQATTVDIISGGRLELGIGAAWHPYEHHAFGIPFHHTRERLDRLEEAVRVIKLLWTLTRPRFDGRYYQLAGPPYNPANLQQPHPPIMVGGGGERRTLRIVAQYADACNVSGTPEDVRRKLHVLEQHCREVGTDFSRIRRTAYIPLFIDADGGYTPRGREAVRSIISGSIREVKQQVRSFVDAGVQEFILGRLRIHMEELRLFSSEIIPGFR